MEWENDSLGLSLRQLPKTQYLLIVLQVELEAETKVEQNCELEVETTVERNFELEAEMELEPRSLPYSGKQKNLDVVDTNLSIVIAQEEPIFVQNMQYFAFV